MQTQVRILHHDYPGRLRETVEGKLERLERFCSWIHVMRANLERQNELHRVELIANVGKGQVLVADVRGGSFLAVLDEAVDRMARQLRKHHDRVTIDRHRPRRRAS